MTEPELYKAAKQWVEECGVSGWDSIVQAGAGTPRRRSESDFICPESAIKCIVIEAYTKKLNNYSLRNRIRLAINLIKGKL